MEYFSPAEFFFFFSSVNSTKELYFFFFVLFLFCFVFCFSAVFCTFLPQISYVRGFFSLSQIAIFNGSSLA